MKAFDSLFVQAIPTRIFHPGEDIVDFIVQQIHQKQVKESMVIAVTSKIVSLSENRLLEKSKIDKKDLINQEAEHNFGEIGYGCYLTIKEGLFIPSAGIDESNSEHNSYILYPKKPFESAQKIWMGLRSAWGVKNLGILLTDSHTTPLRKGVTGIALAHWGFRGLKNMVGTPDLFGRELQMTTVNIADGLASAATLMMGESNESRPLALIETSPLDFTETIDPNEVRIPLRDDLYYPFFKNMM